MNPSRRILNQFPNVKATLRALRRFLSPHHASISSNYEKIPDSAAIAEAARLRNAWQSDSMPSKQRALVDKQLSDYRRGAPVPVFDLLVNALRSLGLSDQWSVLEIGCSSGYYSEVFDIAQLPISYAGCDYSEAFVSLAQSLYPALSFQVEDATKLSYADGSFDVAISGGCLLHIPEYAVAVSEAHRVAISHAIFHRTPVVLCEATQFFKKHAYGVETIEIHFNEDEFLQLLETSGFKVINTLTLDEEYDAASKQCVKAMRTYICAKVEK